MSSTWSPGAIPVAARSRSRYARSSKSYSIRQTGRAQRASVVEHEVFRRSLTDVMRSRSRRSALRRPRGAVRRPGTRGPPHLPRRRGDLGRDAYRVERPDVGERFVELDPPAAAEDHVDLLGAKVAVGEWAPLPGPQAEVRHAGLLGPERRSRDARFPMRAEPVRGRRVLDVVQADVRVSAWRPWLHVHRRHRGTSYTRVW